MNEKFCECGCGQYAPIASRNSSVRGWVKGQPIRFIKHHHVRVQQPRYGPYKKIRWLPEDRGYKTDCHVWQLSVGVKGYGGEYDTNRRRMVAAHILAWERVNGPVPTGHELDHLCKQRDCVRVDHLQVVTHAENVRRGSKTTVTYEQIDEVKRLLARHVAQDSIARQIGIGQSTVSRIKRGDISLGPHRNKTQ